MTIIMYGFAAVFCVLLVIPWVVLLASPLVTASGVVVGLPIVAVRRLRGRRSRAHAVAREGVLCLEGLGGERRMARRVRADLDRVLRLAPAGTRPKACGCVKRVDGGFVGVLRVFNSKGHYLLRATGQSVAAVATRFVETLDTFTAVFPAPPGARRERCEECDPKTCPLRQLSRQRVAA